MAYSPESAPNLIKRLLFRLEHPGDELPAWLNTSLFYAPPYMPPSPPATQRVSNAKKPSAQRGARLVCSSCAAAGKPSAAANKQCYEHLCQSCCQSADKKANADRTYRAKCNIHGASGSYGIAGTQPQLARPPPLPDTPNRAALRAVTLATEPSTAAGAAPAALPSPVASAPSDAPPRTPSKTAALAVRGVRPMSELWQQAEPSAASSALVRVNKHAHNRRTDEDTAKTIMIVVWCSASLFAPLSDDYPHSLLTGCYDFER
jgi:hypothetical protein